MSPTQPRLATGTCGFRLMPTDELAVSESTARIESIGPTQYAISYSWVHPTDGPQRGTLLVSGPIPPEHQAVQPDDDAVLVTAALADSWHQQPGLMLLTGTLTRTGGILLEAEYGGGFSWQIELEALQSRSISMTMRNVIPEAALAMAPPEAAGITAGPYEAMVARWTVEG